GRFRVVDEPRLNDAPRLLMTLSRRRREIADLELFVTLAPFLQVALGLAPIARAVDSSVVLWTEAALEFSRASLPSRSHEDRREDDHGHDDDHDPSPCRHFCLLLAVGAGVVPRAARSKTTRSA